MNRMCNVLLSCALYFLISQQFCQCDTIAKVTDEVTFTIAVDGKTIGDVVLGLFGEDTPDTVKNFITFAGDGYKKNDKLYKYEGSTFHRIIENFMIQGGDMVSGNGFGGISIYGDRFNDENFKNKHSKPGLLSMANSGRNTNGCQFFITLVSTPWLDGKHVVFGEVTSGMDVVRAIENKAASRDGTPRANVVIEHSTVKTL